MRQFYLLFSLLCILALAACGTEEELTPPAFSNMTGSGSLGSITILTAPFRDLNVSISGNVDDLAATIVANSTVTGEVPVAVDSSDGSWSFPFAPQEGANIISFIASDKRGNLNQMILTVLHDTIAPLVIAVLPSVDSLQLNIIFNEALLDTSLTTALFSVVDADGTTVVASRNATVVTPSTVNLLMDVALLPGSYRLLCPEVKDIATPDGNSVAADYSFPFTIVPIVE